jgi:hypothetical protein
MKRRICDICNSLMKMTLAAVDRVWGVELGFAVQAVEQPHCICSSGSRSCKKVEERNASTRYCYTNQNTGHVPSHMQFP